MIRGVTFRGILLMFVFFSLQALAQQGRPSNSSPVYVPMPKDIRCSISGISTQSVESENARLAKKDGSVESFTCWITTKAPKQEVEIPIGSSDTVGGVVTTKDFGKLKIAPTNGVNGGIAILIRSDKLQSFRAFVQKRESELIARNKQLNVRAVQAWALIQSENPDPAELSDALNAVAKAGLLEKPNEDGVTLLNKSAQLGLLSACQQLVELGANPNAADAQGRSALHFAAATLPALYDVLVAKGGNENAPDAQGITPAEIAGRFIQWKNIQAPADENGVKDLSKPHGPFFSIRSRMSGDLIVEAKDVFSVAGESKAHTKIRVTALGSGNLQVSSNTGVDTVSQSERCLMLCLLLPYGSELELTTSVFLWGKLFAPGTLRLQRDGVRFEPSNAKPPSGAEDRKTGNVTAFGSIAPGADFSGGSSLSFASPTATKITIDPSEARIRASESLQFQATSTSGGKDTITWSIMPQLGRISSSGLYEAPSMIARTERVTVTATSTLDPRESAKATITLNSK